MRSTRETRSGKHGRSQQESEQSRTLPAPSGGPISVLLLGLSQSGRCNERVVRFLQSTVFKLTQAADRREARELLRRTPAPSVVITVLSLPDGNWCDLVKDVVRLETGSAVVLCSPRADERLWSEAIWRGVYDILVEPFDHNEVIRCIEGAHRSRTGVPFRKAAEA
jgi:DNA-binding NtrC family response regulator